MNTKQNMTGNLKWHGVVAPGAGSAIAALCAAACGIDALPGGLDESGPEVATDTSSLAARPLFQLPVRCNEVWRLSTYNGHDDYEIDMTWRDGASSGRPIVASYAGTVMASGFASGAGNRVRIYHGEGWQTEYYHMISTPIVGVGQHVEQGQTLGFVGSTGDSSTPHLHYAQRSGGSSTAMGTVVRSYFNGVPSDITDDARANAYFETSRNCGGPPSTGVAEVSKFADIDGDGRSDLIGISGANNDLTAYLNQGWNSVELIVGWQRLSLVSGFGDASRTTFADMDGDGRADLIGVSGANNDLTAYRNQGNGPNGVFVGWDRKHIVSGFGPLTDVKFADIDGDGRADLIGASGVANDLTAYRNQGWGAPELIVGWDRKHIVSGFGRLSGVKFADIDGDRRADLIGASGVANDLTAYRNQGWSATELIVGWDRKHIVSGFGPLAPLKIVDVDGDGRADLIGVSGVNIDMTAYRNQGWNAAELIVGWDRKHVVSGFPP
jgi:hypothetical protein